jgi:hypothetical protein
MNQQILRSEIKEAIKTNRELQFKIAMVHKGKNGQTLSFRTLDTWLRTDSDKLTMAKTLKVIRDHLRIGDPEILTEKPEMVN